MCESCLRTHSAATFRLAETMKITHYGSSRLQYAWLAGWLNMPRNAAVSIIITLVQFQCPHAHTIALTTQKWRMNTIPLCCLHFYFRKYSLVAALCLYVTLDSAPVRTFSFVFVHTLPPSLGRPHLSLPAWSWLSLRAQQNVDLWCLNFYGTLNALNTLVSMITNGRAYNRCPCHVCCVAM